MIRGPITHQPVPGDLPRGHAERYKDEDAQITYPSLPIRVAFRNALPATFIPILVRGMGGRVQYDERASRYTGLAPSALFDIVRETFAWER